MAISWVVAFTLACVLVVSFGQCANAADLELGKVKANLLDYLTGAQADRQDAAVQASLRDIEQSARRSLTSMRPDGSWEDINYGAGPDQEARLFRHLDRITSLARGFAVPGQALAGTGELVQAAEKAFVFVRPLVGVDCAKPAELINGEGLNSWHVADGLLWVFLRGRRLQYTQRVADA